MTPTARLARLLPDARPDGALLAAFLADRDEPAFAELVRRHGPLVLAACRRLLSDPADTADAFQAAFLVLVRRARRLTASTDLGPWLYRVAAWTARNVRRKNARRLARTTSLPDAVAAPPTCPVPALDLDAALLALPEKYRAALVLCHLQGWSRRDAAARLGCPEGTLSSLLARGLTKLKARLPGYEPAVALAIVPAALSAATVSAAVKPMPSAAAELAAVVLRALWVPKATAAGVAVIFALGAGVGLSVREAPVVAQAPTAPAPREKAAPPVDELAKMLKEYNLAVHESTMAGMGKEFAALELKHFEERLARARKRLQAEELTPDRRAELEEQEKDVLRTVEQARRELAHHERRVALSGRVVELLGERLDARRREVRPEVSGTLATDVRFPDAACDRIGEATRGLVEGATHSADGADGAWEAARRLPHVHVRFPAPRRTVRVPGAADIAVAEVLVPLPLTRAPGGYVLVRDGGRVVSFSKYPHAAAARFQEALGAAVPAAR